jgi:hypothetical protein
MFSYTFRSFAYNSTTATIHTGLFDSINLSGATNVSYMFSYAFNSYAYANSTPATDINTIWGNANFAGKVTADNAGGLTGVFYYTFNGMRSLTGIAQTFIDTRLGGIVPVVDARTFSGTSVTDLSSLHSAWWQ